MLILLVLGFVGSYATAAMVATVMQTNNPWAVTGIGTVLFATFVAIRNPRKP